MLKRPISDILVCDLFGKKGEGTAIIEIETGFTPPEHALDTVDYYTARIVSKIARYSKYCGKVFSCYPRCEYFTNIQHLFTFSKFTKI